MKNILNILITAAVFLSIHQAAAQGTTAFTYQGQLHDGGTNANGAYTMIFSLYNAASGGTQVGGTITTTPTLANGLFSVNLDFGNVFTGNPYWLDITVTNGGTSQELSPRVQLLPTPYAMSAVNLANGIWNVGVTNVTGDSILYFAQNNIPTSSGLALHSNGQIARIANGIGIGSNGGEITSSGSGNLTLWNNVTVTGNPGTISAVAFNTTSDQSLKENFTPIDSQSVLERVASLPISQWNFKQDESTRHIGPMAQDFYSAFNVGTDDKHIATVDEDGVALAAIQGLNQKLDERDAELQTLKSQNESLEKRLADLERLVKASTQK